MRNRKKLAAKRQYLQRLRKAYRKVDDWLSAFPQWPGGRMPRGRDRRSKKDKAYAGMQEIRREREAAK